MRDTTILMLFIIYFMSDNLESMKRHSDSQFEDGNFNSCGNIAFDDNPEQIKKNILLPQLQINNHETEKNLFEIKDVKEKPTNHSQEKKKSSDPSNNFEEFRQFSSEKLNWLEEPFFKLQMNYSDPDDNDEEIEPESYHGEEPKQIYVSEKNQQNFQIYHLEPERKLQINYENKENRQQTIKQNSSLIFDTLKFSQNEEDLIMRQINPSSEQIKNTNFAKFVVKHFQKRLMINEEYKDLVIDNPQWAFFNKINFHTIQEYGINRINLEHLTKLFGRRELKEQKEYIKKNRHLVRDMLRSKQFLHENVLFKAYMKSFKNKKQYLLASKVFSLRCRSSLLTQRMETK